MIEVKETAVPGGFDSDLILYPKARPKIVRKQALVVRPPWLLNADEKKKLREDIHEQLQTGVVILPHDYVVLTCDCDMIVWEE